jgi:hypothetical protein
VQKKEWRREGESEENRREIAGIYKLSKRAIQTL